MDQYYRVDLSITKGFQFNSLDSVAGISIWNVFNTQNIINRYFVNQEGIIKQFNINSLGFTPNIFLRFNL
ncbi:MAG: hypothetical protein HRT68_00905 [Flavobacteriaceae bacterium]|nr:hypothetical protein [Flavobacteriaceae bacterium]